MKTRRKNNIEMSHDIKLLDEARRDLAEEAVNFLHEFNQTEGRCIPYFSVMDFQDKVW